MEKKPHLCTVCGAAFTDESDLQRHSILQNHSEKPHECENIKEEPLMYLDVRVKREDNGVEEDNDEDKSECTWCNATFENQKNFEDHIQEHINTQNTSEQLTSENYHKKLTLKCTVCKRTFEEAIVNTVDSENAALCATCRANRSNDKDGTGTCTKKRSHTEKLVSKYKRLHEYLQVGCSNA